MASYQLYYPDMVLSANVDTDKTIDVTYYRTPNAKFDMYTDIVLLAILAV